VPALTVRDGQLYAHCGGGGTLRVLLLEIDGDPSDARDVAVRFGGAPAPLGA